MDIGLLIGIICLIILLFLSAFFSSAETAFTTANKIRIRTLAEEEDNARAKKVLEILENPSKMLSAILVGNNIVNLSASSLATTIAVKVFGSIGAGLATFVLTFLVLIFGEISPKTMATLNAEKLSLRYCNVIAALMWAFTPIIFLVNKLSHGFIRLIGVNIDEEKPLITEGELRKIVDVSHEGGVIESDEKEIIYNLFDFSDSMAKEIMIPRIDMIMIDDEAGYEELMELYRQYKLTRIPVYHESNDNVIGFVNMKDVLLIENTKHFSIRQIIRQPYFTHEHKKTTELFVEMKSYRVNIAIILDEYGGAAGMLTLEDLLEEIVGEIRDEYDDDEEDDISRISDNEFILNGMADIDDVNQALGFDFDSEDYETIGGYIIGLSDTLPKNGQVIRLDDGTYIRIERIRNNRIEKIYLRKAAEE
ncbi:MAG: hemolysin family protein [Eubacterium sp.]|nr:hemolysin family protein [Eubacterium sp.]